jgi:hypothetical protein
VGTEIAQGYKSQERDKNLGILGNAQGQVRRANVEVRSQGVHTELECKKKLKESKLNRCKQDLGDQ